MLKSTFFRKSTLIFFFPQVCENNKGNKALQIEQLFFKTFQKRLFCIIFIRTFAKIKKKDVIFVE